MPNLSSSRQKWADVGMPRPAQFIRAVAASKATSAPEFMQGSVAHAWCHRWLKDVGVHRGESFCQLLAETPFSCLNWQELSRRCTT